MKDISIIIPTFNEEANIEPLVKHLDSILKRHSIGYEIVFIDDHSTDSSLKMMRQLSTNYPIKIFLKSGKRGKPHSLLEAYQVASYPLIAVIDSDQQYPPEALPAMIDRINSSTDVVVANRIKEPLETWDEKLHKKIREFTKNVLHKLDHDIHTGLIVFKRQIPERLRLNPLKYHFDFEFLLHARHAGYRISTYDIELKPRKTGETKINLFKSALHLLHTSLHYKFNRPPIIPFHKTQEEEKGKGFHFKGMEFIHHTTLRSNESAFFQLVFEQKLILVVLALLLINGLLINWMTTLTILIGILTILYFSDLIFNFFLIIRSFAHKPELTVSQEEIKNYKKEWPRYTIFCPLYREWNVVSQFVKAISALDYPKDKLQAMLLLEEDDTETIQKIQAMKLPEYFEIMIVPHSLPKTKPKAMNYGLSKTTGEYVVIYDAEDVPDVQQLKKVVIAFEKSDNKTVCIQAKLNFYNPHQNILTRVFTAEYSLWFDLVLTGLQSVNAPIPLGGTSNHFKIKDIYQLQGWDSFNVTEDCDLGIRLAKKGYKTAIVDSETLEEANSDLANWLNQRSRWIKGYIQTYFVHMRNPAEVWKNLSKRNFVAFQLIVGGKILSMYINPFMWLITIIYFVFRAKYGLFIERFFPGPIFYMGLFAMVFGNFLYMYYYMIGCARREQEEIIKYVFLVPVYWLFMSIAAWKGLLQLIFNPHYWPKTRHGLHLSATS